MYFATQRYQRSKRHPDRWGAPDPNVLNSAYDVFSEASESLEYELAFVYGWDSRSRVRWHQVRDLLTVRYFGLLHDDGIPEASLRRVNAKGYKKEFHSGLSDEDLAHSDRLLGTYRRATRDLAAELASDSLTIRDT